MKNCLNYAFLDLVMDYVLAKEKTETRNEELMVEKIKNIF